MEWNDSRPISLRVGMERAPAVPEFLVRLHRFQPVRRLGHITAGQVVGPAIGRKQVALNREVSSLALEGSKTRLVRGQHHHDGLIPHPVVDNAVFPQAVPVIGCPASA